MLQKNAKETKNSLFHFLAKPCLNKKKIPQKSNNIHPVPACPTIIGLLLQFYNDVQTITTV